MEEKNIGKWIVGGVLGFIVLVSLISAIGSVSAGEVGIKTRFGAVAGTVGQGLYVKAPFIEHITKMNVQTQKEQTDATAASKDLQTVTAKVAVNYNLVENQVTDLYTRIGTEYGAKIIDPAIQEVVKAVTAKYTAEELITKRPQVTDDIQKSLGEKLALSDIRVTGVSIVNFDFSPQFNAAIELKVTAEQNALAAKNKLDQIKYEAAQTVATAQAQAEAIKIQAQAINSQGGADYVALKKTEKWDGKACTSYCGIEAMTNLLNTK